jgi:hypothetical protein
MPKLYEYLGIVVLFYSNEHEPIHVHGRHQGRESKAELIIQNGEVVEIRIAGVKGKRPLESKELRHFKTLVEHFQQDIINKWIEFFVYNRPFDSVIINRELK